jgi:hypothetical protein
MAAKRRRLFQTPAAKMRSGLLNRCVSDEGCGDVRPFGPCRPPSMRMKLEADKPEPFVVSDAVELFAVFSPDAQWIGLRTFPWRKTRTKYVP